MAPSATSHAPAGNTDIMAHISSWNIIAFVPREDHDHHPSRPEGGVYHAQGFF